MLDAETVRLTAAQVAEIGVRELGAFAPAAHGRQDSTNGRAGAGIDGDAVGCFYHLALIFHQPCDEYLQFDG